MQSSHICGSPHGSLQGFGIKMPPRTVPGWWDEGAWQMGSKTMPGGQREQEREGGSHGKEFTTGHDMTLLVK